MASVKKFLDNMTGEAEAREQAKKEAASLIQLANSKLDNLENKMRDMFRNKKLEAQVEIVGDRMGAFSREYRVNYSDGDMGDAVDELIGQIMSIGSEKAAAIISKAIKNSLKAMFTSVNVTEEEKRIFVVLLEGAAMVRYDIWIWKSCEQDQSLFKHTESVVAITYARSVVDHTKLTEDELNDGIYRSLGGASLQEILEYKKELLELFKLKANDGVCATANSCLSAEPTGRELDSALMTMIRATSENASAEGAASIRRPAAQVTPEVRELLTMDAGEYKPV